MYEILNKDTIKFENLTLLSATKCGHTQKNGLLDNNRCILSKLKAGFLWHVMKRQNDFLCFLCSYVKKNCTYAKKLSSCQNGRIYVKTRKGKRQSVEAVVTFKISIN